MRSLGTLLVFFLLSSPAPMVAQVQVEMQPNKITVGDPVELTLTAPLSVDVTIIWPGPDELKPAEIIKSNTIKIGRTEQQIKYILSIFEPGQFELKHVPVVFSSASQADTVFVDPGSIVVESVLSPTDSAADIRDIHPPVKLSWTLRELLPYIIAGLVIILAGVIGYILWRRYKIRKGEIVPTGPPPPPAHVIALRRLEELRIKKLWQNGYLKEYHSELTEIVKEYIGGRYKLNAPEMTTDEMLESRNNWAENDEGFRQVKRILTSGDLVKFAKFKPEPQENDGNLTHAFTFVEATKPDESDNGSKSKVRIEAEEVLA